MSFNPHYTGRPSLPEEIDQTLLNRFGRSLPWSNSAMFGSSDGTLGVWVNDEVGVSGVVVLVPQEGSLYGSELGVKSCLLVSQGLAGLRRPSPRRPSPFLPPPFNLHSPILHPRTLLRRLSLQPFTAPPFTLHSALLHPSIPPSTTPPFTVHPVALQPSLLHPSLPPFTLPLSTLQSTALYPSLLHPSLPRFTAPPVTRHSAALPPSLSQPSLRRPALFFPPLVTLHSATVHYPLSLRRTLLHRPSLPHHPPFAAPPFTLHSAALHPSLPHPLLPPFTAPPFTAPPFTPALHCAALHLYPRRPSFSPVTLPLITPTLHSVARTTSPH
jgi:hypothetical protein